MKISMINIIVSAFVLSVCGFFGTFYYLRYLRSEKMKKYRLKLRMKGTDFYLRYVQRKA